MVTNTVTTSIIANMAPIIIIVRLSTSGSSTSLLSGFLFTMDVIDEIPGVKLKISSISFGNVGIVIISSIGRGGAYVVERGGILDFSTFGTVGTNLVVLFFGLVVAAVVVVVVVVLVLVGAVVVFLIVVLLVSGVVVGFGVVSLGVVVLVVVLCVVVLVVVAVVVCLVVVGGLVVCGTVGCVTVSVVNSVKIAPMVVW